MVTGALLVVALAVAPIAWAAPIFDLSGGFLCSTWWDYCNDDDVPKEGSPANGGIAINNAVVVNVSGNIGTQGPGNGTQGPGSGTQGPGSAAQAPGSATQGPGSATPGSVPMGSGTTAVAAMPGATMAPPAG